MQGIVFPANANETTHLRNVAAGCSSLVWHFIFHSLCFGVVQLRQQLAQVFVSSQHPPSDTDRKDWGENVLQSILLSSIHLQCSGR